MNYDEFLVNKYIIVQDDRIFIDICRSGCGSSCKYCYSPYRDKAQVLLLIDEIKLICQYIENNYLEKLRIVSLCPNTEPFKSQESAKLVLYIVEFFTKLNCKIQISTKERLDISLLEKLNKISKKNLFINVSIPLIIKSSNIEPYAAPIEDRFANFERIAHFDKLVSSLYIKPFLSNKSDYPKYIEYINKLSIKYVCVGINFHNQSDIPCLSLYNKKVTLSNLNQQGSELLKFISMVRKETEAKVFASSTCYMYDCDDNGCSLCLYRYSKTLCENCIMRIG